jgi:sulfopyruvate decarboxylase TPP-binding subunit
MIDGPSIAAALTACAVTHVIWIPDSETGTWEPALRACPDLRLLRVCREGEAIALAAGLILGGQRPVVVIQCTGLFEAGDALRNVVHDMKLPLYLIVGLRNYYAFQQKSTRDTCPIFAEPIVKAWQVPYVLLGRQSTAGDLQAALAESQSQRRPGMALVAE